MISSVKLKLEQKHIFEIRIGLYKNNKGIIRHHGSQKHKFKTRINGITTIGTFFMVLQYILNIQQQHWGDHYQMHKKQNKKNASSKSLTCVWMGDFKIFKKFKYIIFWLSWFKFFSFCEYFIWMRQFNFLYFNFLVWIK